MELTTLIHTMLEDDRLVFNARSLKEAEQFVDVCVDILTVEGLLDEDDYDMLTGEECYSIYGEDTCFTLEFGILEHGSKEYFEEDSKDYNIIVLEDVLV